MPVSPDKSDDMRCSAMLRLRAQPILTEAVDRAAAKNLTTVSEYVRRCVIERLRADGFDLEAA